MTKNIYDYQDAEGFLPETVFDEWCRKNNLRRELSSTPRYDGIYASEVRHYDVKVGYERERYRTQTYLRFYPDGTVLYEDAHEQFLPSPKQMAVVFKKESKEVKSRGVYKLRGGQIAVEVIKVGPKPGLLRSGPKTEHSFLGLYLDEGLNRGTLYVVTYSWGVARYEFTFVKAYQEELQLQAPVSSAPLRTHPPSVAAPPQALPPSTVAGQLVPRITHTIGTLFVTYQQPGSKVDGLAWSPDGRRIVSFGLGKAQVWVPSSGSVLYDYNVKGFTTIITALTWSPDSTRVATAGSDKAVQIWDASDGHVITAYKGGHNKFIRDVAWSPNGQHIASCEDTELHIWNAVSGQHIFTFTAHPKTLVGMRSLAWSPDATRLASGGGDDHVTVWNPNNGSAIYTYTQQHNTINGLAWSPDGKRIASGSSDKTVHIWAAETGADQVICQGHTKAVNAVAFSPDGKRIASASDDATVRIWSGETGQHLFTYEGHKKGVNTLAWSPDGTYIASGGVDKTVQVWACG